MPTLRFDFLIQPTFLFANKRLKELNVKVDQLLAERSELVNELNEIDEAKSQELQKLVEVFALTKVSISSLVQLISFFSGNGRFRERPA